jgi:hypothetical protein
MWRHFSSRRSSFHSPNLQRSFPYLRKRTFYYENTNMAIEKQNESIPHVLISSSDRAYREQVIAERAPWLLPFGAHSNSHWETATRMLWVTFSQKLPRFGPER